MTLLNAVRRDAAAMDAQRGQPRFATVTSVNPHNVTVQASIQPDGVLSGWMPMATAAIGNGWGILCLPNVGDQVICVPHDGDADNLVVIGAVYSDPQQPPSGAKSGEFWLVHQQGAFIKLLADGTIASNGTWNHTGDMRVTGEVYRGYGGGDQVSLGRHTHTQGADSAGDGEVPTNAPTAGT